MALADVGSYPTTNPKINEIAFKKDHDYKH